MTRRADRNKESGRLSKKHGRRERMEKELGIKKPLTKTQRESKKAKK